MKKGKLPGLVTTGIFTVIAVFTWIAFSVYRALSIIPPVNVPPEILKPLSPELDREALGKLEGRLNFEEGEGAKPLVSQTTPSGAPEASASATPTPAATPALGSVTPTP